MARPAAAVPLGELAGAKAPAALGGASIRAGPDLSPVRRMGQQRMLLEFGVLPRHRRQFAEAAGCARGTVYEAIRALEQVGVLSWVNRIKRVREYVPRPVRQPGATTLLGAGSPAAFPFAWTLARFAS